MTINEQEKRPPGGSAQCPNYHEGPVHSRGDVHLHARYFTYQTDAGLVAGDNFSVMFTLERSAKEVWPYFKDFNRWQKDHYYSGVAGDLEGKPLRLSSQPNEPGPHQYQVLRVIPEHLIVLYQPVPEGNYEGLSWWLGGISPGFHVFMLNEHDDNTVVTVLMNHASLMERASESHGMTEDEALRPWRDEQVVPDALRKWRDDFIPVLKKLVHEGRKGR